MDRFGTHVDDTDRAIIEQLQRDGRAPYTRLGAAVGLSEAAARQDLELLCTLLANTFPDADNW